MLFLTPRASSIIPRVLSVKRVGLHPLSVLENLSVEQITRQGQVLSTVDVMKGKESRHSLRKDPVLWF